MVLVGAGVVAGLQDFFIGHVLQVGAYFPLHEPGKGVEPADDACQFARQHVDGVPLAGMGALVGQNLVQLVAGVGVGADEYPAEEREGAFCAGQEVYGGAVYLLRGAAACQADDASQ